MKDLISIFNKHSLILIGICLILTSCNNSFSVLKRKYRPGYSVSSSSSKIKLKKDPAENSAVIKTDPTADVKEIETFSSSIKNEPLILNYNPEPIVIACDTPPQKGTEEFRSLYKPKKPEDKRTPASNDRLEPLSILVLLGTILIIAIGGVFGYLAVIVPLVLFVLSLISVIRIKRNPKKFRKFSKILAIILLCFYSLIVLGLLIAGVIILSSV